MKLFSINKLLVLSGIALSVAVAPTTASARGSVHIDVPGFSIGFHDDNRHYRKRHKRYHKRHHSKHYSGRSNRYYDGYGYQSRGYRYGSDSYRNRSYRNSYKNGYRSGYKNSYRNDYRGDYCPTPGYSPRYYDDRGCYAHGDHYHCD